MSRRAWMAPAAAVAVAALAAGASPLAASPVLDRRAADRGAAWLARTPLVAPGGQIADTIVALRATGRSRASLRPRLRALVRVAPRYARQGPGAAAKVTLGALAAGVDPTRFGRRDYVRLIGAGYAGGRYGDSAFEHAYALLGLTAARRPIPRTAVRTTLAARGRGGWGFALTPRARDTVDATGLMIEALLAVGVPARHPALRAATAWMVAQRNRTGGYGWAGRGTPTDANSTANAIRALRAMGRPVPAATRAELRRLQTRSGAVRASRSRTGSALLATNDAVVALAGRRLPVR